MSTQYAWQLKDWKAFKHTPKKFAEYEAEFLHMAGMAYGLQKGLSEDDIAQFRVVHMVEEAYQTSAIEGETLNRESLQSSIKRYFELKSPQSKNHPKENGIAKMMVNLFHHFGADLDHQTLWDWHQMLMNGRTDLDAIGMYRFHEEPMQIVSQKHNLSTVHYQAPPSEHIKTEMDDYIKWFNTAEHTPLIKAGIAHLYFEMIHPFEDGNGRIGRALIEKSLAIALKKPSLIAISKEIEKHKTDYYAALEQANKSNQIDGWLDYFCKTILGAQKNSIVSIELLIQKSQFFSKHDAELNERQKKLMLKLFALEKDFVGGISVKNYIQLVLTSTATANRDLNDLIKKGILYKTGELKSTRYWFSLYKNMKLGKEMGKKNHDKR
ncbi:Fic family protein [bacterium]|nr:Fic family protein [bacterium]